MLYKLGNQAADSKGKKAATLLRRMANKAGLTVESGAKHLKVFDPGTGNLITTIPNSPKAKGTIEAIAKAIIGAAGCGQ